MKKVLLFPFAVVFFVLGSIGMGIIKVIEVCAEFVGNAALMAADWGKWIRKIYENKTNRS